MCLAGLLIHVRAMWEDEMVGSELDASFHGVERNLTRLTTHLSMTNVEDLPPHM